MGRKKIDKESITYLSKNLFYKNSVSGFQFTAGNTPLGIDQNRPLTMSCSINCDRGVVIDGSQSYLEKKIGKEVFGENYVIKDLKDLQEQFKNLGYEVDEGEFAGKWYWFRIKCAYDEIDTHVNNLKENLKL